MQSGLNANFINFSMLKIMENRSLIDVCSTIQSALFGVPESEKQRICKVFEGKFEGNILGSDFVLIYVFHLKSFLLGSIDPSASIVDPAIY